ncbi:diiron oxygenase [Pseudomonas sp. RIT-PI-S]|uniref:diiron oxygenase n=1 Tax=Pseudomonas sp. RIT-PI-S TaxID=3035295 RepID=UPI0021D8C8F8|nr:diiron oxygenase [Pseudomonas sp. RIT-PI-S]
MNALTYVSFAEQWERRATIRTRPRRQLEHDDRLIYPLSRQPLAVSAVLQRECPEQRDFVLLQTLYKFINDIVIFETEIVDKTARSIAKGHFPVAFPLPCRYDAMTVVVDEDYHALVAMDFLQQTIASTGIQPIAMPEEIELSRAIPAAMEQAPTRLRAAIELICVSIAENTVTNDVAAFAKDDTVKPSIKGLMADHLADEGRHSAFWTDLTRLYWTSASEADRAAIAEQLPVFIEQYLTNDIQKRFDTQLIEALPVPPAVAEALKREIVGLAFPIGPQHPLVMNIIRFFRRSTLLDTPCVRAALAPYLS